MPNHAAGIVHFGQRRRAGAELRAGFPATEGESEEHAEGQGTSCGKVESANGQVDVVAVDTAAGTVGCDKDGPAFHTQT